MKVQVILVDPCWVKAAFVGAGVEVCGFRRLRTGIPIDRGQSFQRIADSIPMIADSSPIDGF